MNQRSKTCHKVFSTVAVSSLRPTRATFRGLVIFVMLLREVKGVGLTMGFLSLFVGGLYPD